VPSFIKKEPKDGMITESSKKSSRKETRYYYSTLKSKYLVTLYLKKMAPPSPSLTSLDLTFAETSSPSDDGARRS
jgi:hypothetical protein